MSWNHMILAHEYNGDIYFQIHEVFYDKEGKPYGYTENPVSVGSENIKGITWTLYRMLECRTKPILWAGKKFPNECKITYTCDICGRNDFKKTYPHKCLRKFRKHGMKWTINYK